MCGICGIVRSDSAAVERASLERMNAAIRHRGPDSDGFYFAPGVGLGMRRLAIIDLQTGDQPIPNEDETVWVIQNGEIYNFPELRADLERRGHHFRTQSDTECIVHLYEEYGQDCVQHMRGMFAFAVWDTRKNQLLLGRDRLGQKPLHYTVQDGMLYFSSELPSLLEGLPERPSRHLPAIDLYLSLQYIPEPLTPFESIYKLPAAHTLVYDVRSAECEVRRYWQLSYEPKWEASEDELADELRQRLTEAVRMRMISDVPLGAHLSGGIDSSIIVALMAELSSQPVKTFSVGFEESSFSELAYARAIAERYATDHHEFILSFGDVPATLTEIVKHLGEPVADPASLPLYHLSRLTREHVTVALNGDGGDEAFAGYHRYWLDPWANRYNNLPRLLTHKLIPALADLFPDPADRPIGRGWVNGLKRLEQVASIDPRASILRWGSYFSPTWKTRLWREEYQAQLDDRSAEGFLVETFQSPHAETFMDRTLYTDNHTYLPGDLLVKADRMTMAHSLEGRSPFLDHEVAAWAARLPTSMKVRGRTGKYLLRKAFAGELPPSVGGRGKQGFSVPLGAWFRDSLSDWAEDILLDSDNCLKMWFNPSVVRVLLDEHQRGKENHGKRIYALVILALWNQRMYG